MLTVGRSLLTSVNYCLLLTAYYLLLTCRKGSVYHASASAVYSPSEINSCGVVSAAVARAHTQTHVRHGA